VNMVAATKAAAIFLNIVVILLLAALSRAAVSFSIGAFRSWTP